MTCLAQCFLRHLKIKDMKKVQEWEKRLNLFILDSDSLFY